MKKRLFLLTSLLTMAVLPLAACGQNDTTNRDRIKIEEPKTYDTPEEIPPTPETCPDACPDCEDCPSSNQPQGDSFDEAPDETPNPETKPPEFIKPPEFRRDLKDRMPRRIGTFGFVLVMPSPQAPPLESKLPSPDQQDDSVLENG